jgi:hypothetical protein
MADEADKKFIYTPDPEAGTFKVLLAQEGVRTVDNRVIEFGALDWRTLPVTLLLQRQNDPTGEGGHKAAVAIGSVHEIWREEISDTVANVWGRGSYSSDEEGQNARQLIGEGVLSTVSADVGAAFSEFSEEFDAEGNVDLVKVVKSGTIVAATVLPLSAFGDTKISNITASAGNWKPSKEFFTNPELSGPTPITVTEDGRVYGHAALWDSCHVGYRNSCVRPPRSRSNYAFFNVGQVETSEGEVVNVGRIAAGTNHADQAFAAQPAKEHYDNTGWAAAYVASGEDKHGIWFSGAVAPHATPDQIAVLKAASVSGDWRAINGALELVGILAVNSPGFPIPRSQTSIVAGAQISLIAASPCLTADAIEATETTEEDSTEVEPIIETVTEFEAPTVEEAASVEELASTQEIDEEDEEDDADQIGIDPDDNDADDEDEEDDDDEELSARLAMIDMLWGDLIVDEKVDYNF